MIGPEGGAWGGGASGDAGEGAAGVDVLVVSSSKCEWPGMSVGSCPTLQVESESHQHINPSAKCISTPGLTLLREARTKALLSPDLTRVLGLW